MDKQGIYCDQCTAVEQMLRFEEFSEVSVVVVKKLQLFKVRYSYGPLAYFSDIHISGKNENVRKICKRTIT